MNAKGQRNRNRLKERLAAAEVCLGATITLNSPVVAELWARVGFDWLWFEMEHTPMSVEAVNTMLAVTNGTDVGTIVRVPANDMTIIKRVVDTGPDGILVPQINTRAEAEAAVRAMKYPPLGERGAGLARAQGYGLAMGEYYRSANHEVLTLMMIEHIQGVENIEEILSVQGVDGIMIGGIDLSGSMGLLEQGDHPSVEAAIQRVLTACQAAKIPCGILGLDPDSANRRIEQGFTLMIVALDVLLLGGGAATTLSHIKR
jgi:2-keto-3-deoxy-L-rhamnonate aldolase RhmA